jgi:hypothetical protein
MASSENYRLLGTWGMSRTIRRPSLRKFTIEVTFSAILLVMPMLASGSPPATSGLRPFVRVPSGKRYLHVRGEARRADKAQAWQVNFAKLCEEGEDWQATNAMRTQVKGYLSR